MAVCIRLRFIDHKATQAQPCPPAITSGHDIRTIPLTVPLTLVYDLDGTLVDTALDLIAATNHVLTTIGRPAATAAILRPQVSHGALAMIRAGVGPDAASWPESDLYPLFDRFIAYYQANIAVESAPFPGMIASLDRAQAAGHTLAICTNKRESLARQLLEGLGLADRFVAIAGRDTFAMYKPDPGHLLSTIAMARGTPTLAVMIGDSNVDIATAKAASIPVIAVSFGYCEPPVATFAPDVLIDHYDHFDAALAKVHPKRT